MHSNHSSVLSLPVLVSLCCLTALVCETVFHLTEHKWQGNLSLSWPILKKRKEKISCIFASWNKYCALMYTSKSYDADKKRQKERKKSIWKNILSDCCGQFQCSLFVLSFTKKTSDAIQGLFSTIQNVFMILREDKAVLASHHGNF